MPIVLDQSIHELSPQYFWLGGGRVSLKIGISVPEIQKYLANRLHIFPVTN
jgi:hypothetical protein